MYEFNDFGKRLADLRKATGMTQESVATRLGVSPQAVSKWENDACYPDITILPALADLLNTNMETLFGSSNRERVEDFTEWHEDLPFIHSFGHVGVYSDKTPAQAEGDFVTFTDGSSVKLSEQLVVNKGVGEVKFLFIDKQTQPVKNTQTEFVFTEEIHTLRVKAICGDYHVRTGNDDKTVIKIQGASELIAGICAQVSGQTLNFEHRQQNERNQRGELNVEIIMAAGDFDGLEYHINGSADIRSDIIAANAHFHINGSGDIVHPGECDHANAEINGSGDINLGACHESLRIGINGSGDIDCAGSAGETNTTINGSGDISLGHITGCFNAAINGSGDMQIRSGEVESFDVRISGSGEIDAREVIAQRANINVEQSGEVVLGQVIYESTEKHGKNASITVLKRGL